MLFERTELPFPDNKIEIFTDGNDDYTHILSDYYADTCINYGQLIKIRDKGRVVDKEREKDNLWESGPRRYRNH